MMKKIILQVVAIILITLSTACAPKMLKPGDKIGNMEIVNYCEGNNIIEICSYEELEKGTCSVPSSWTTFWVSFGWAEPTIEELNTTFKDSTWKLTFDGKPIDINSFGTYDLDVQDPLLGPMKARVWDICIINPSSGAHTAQYDYKFVNGTRIGNHTEIWTFTVEK
jgi:hypothetical protein